MADKQTILFFVYGDIDNDLAPEIEPLVERLTKARKWLIAPPQFVDSIEEPENPIDEPIRTLGGHFEIFSALPPNRLSPEIDKVHLSEVETTVDMLLAFSKEKQMTFQIELDGQLVGEIENGSPDRSLTDGLLNPWRAHLSQYA